MIAGAEEENFVLSFAYVKPFVYRVYLTSKITGVFHQHDSLMFDSCPNSFEI